VATYNIHKCRGLDRKISPHRIIAVIKEVDADIVCLQETVHAPAAGLHFDQASEIGRALPEYTWRFGANRRLHGGDYGNMTLTRLPLRAWNNYDLSHRKREKRGVLQTDIELGPDRLLHVFNVHLGTGHAERRSQVERLMSSDILNQPKLIHPRLVAGDFNEWTRGLTTRLLEENFQTFRPRHGLSFPRTYPGILPLLSLDFYYYEAPLQIAHARLHRSPRALVASDHLPLVADFEILTTI
jgi:endonuclease/exonuclease/phosphatase family metal-dependent hydrolase